MNLKNIYVAVAALALSMVFGGYNKTSQALAKEPSLSSYMQTDSRSVEQPVVPERNPSGDIPDSQVLKFEAVEAFIAGAGGVLLGVALTYTAGKLIAPTGTTMHGVAFFWIAGAAIAGFLLALGATMYPAWKQARHFTVAASKALVRRASNPLWQKLYLDFIVLGIAFLEYWRAAGTGYQVVLAPEGVPQISVHYEAFIAPLFLLGAFIWSEGLLILVGGGAIGTILGFGIAQILVKVLTGVFDPPPEHLYIPWGYMAVLAATAIVSTVIVVFGMKIISRRPVVE